MSDGIYQGYEMSQKPKEDERLRDMCMDGFHKHLDECSHCEQHPFDLCETGKVLLLAFANTVPKLDEMLEGLLVRKVRSE
jgi:hypothetical protein